MSQLFSQAQLEQLKNYLEQFFATKEDVRREIRDLEERLNNKFSDLQDSVDTYLKRTED